MTGSRTLLSLLVVCCGVLFAAAAAAVTLDNLFEATVAVPDKEIANREPAIRDALAAVLVKLTGREEVVTQPVASSILARSRSYLQRFAYEEEVLPPDPNDFLAQPRREVRLRAWFDADALQAAVRSAGLPLWGRERPQTLVWLAMEVDGQRLLFSRSPESNAAGINAEVDGMNAAEIVEQAMADEARRRGVPYRLPMLDNEDRAVIGFADVWGGFEERILRASERYDAYGVLAGNIFDAGNGRWSARWVHYSEAGQLRWQSVADSLEAAVATGIAGVADRYARKFAVDTAVAGAERIEVEISGVETLDDYARALAYLESLSLVQSIQVERVFEQNLVLQVRIVGDREALEQAIGIGNILVPEEVTELVIDLDNPDSPLGSGNLKYKLAQ